MLRPSNSPPRRVYSPGSVLRQPGNLLLQIRQDFWQYRELVLALFLRDLRAQYRQAFLGYLWIIVPPLATAAVWFLINQQKLVAVATDSQVSYPAFVLIGTTLWGAFTAAVVAPMDAIANNREVLVKLNVPVEAFLFAALLKAVFELTVLSIILLPILAVLGYGLPITWLLFPLAATALLLQGFAAGLVLAPFSTLYRDFRNGITPLLGILMFLAPVVYPTPKQPESWLGTLIAWNPLSPTLQLARATVLAPPPTFSLSWFVCLATALLVIAISIIAIRVARPHLIARMGM